MISNCVKKIDKWWIVVIVAILLLPSMTAIHGCRTAADEGTVLKVGSTKPYKTTNKFGDYWYGVLSGITTHDSLIKLDSNMQPVPWLASGWEISADSTQFTFTIRQGVKWHDGAALTADDVKFSIEYYRDSVPDAAWMKGVIDTVEVSGNNVILNLTKPYGNLLTEFMSYTVNPMHIWQDIDEPLQYEGADRVIGSGPFKLQSWDAATGRYVFIANPGHFMGKPNVDRLEVDVYGNMDAMVMALAQGTIDTWWDYSGEFPFTYIPALIKSGKVEFAAATFLGVPAAIGFNLGGALTGQLAFRQAVAKAINYEYIKNSVFFGYGTMPTYGFAPSTHPNFDDTIPELEYQASEATALLSGLGLTDTNSNGRLEMTPGQDINLKLLARSDQASILLSAQLVKGYLEAVGIGCHISAVDSSTWTATKDAMNYDIVFFRATPWGTMVHASHGSAYFDSRRTGTGVLHNLNESDYLANCDARLSTAILSEQKVLDRNTQQMHYEYLPGIALAWIDSVYPYVKGWDDWTIDHIYGGVVNSFSWFTVTKT